MSDLNLRNQGEFLNALHLFSLNDVFSTFAENGNNCEIDIDKSFSLLYSFSTIVERAKSNEK